MEMFFIVETGGDRLGHKMSFLLSSVDFLEFSTHSGPAAAVVMI